MSMIDRIKTLWQARANRALDAAESKDLSGILQVNIDTEKGHIQKAEEAVNQLGGQVKSMEQNIAQLEQAASDWGHNAETALAKGNEDLAKQALGRQTTIEQELATKKSALGVLKSSHARLSQEILEREERVRDATSKLATLRAEEKAADITLEARKTVGAHAGDGNALNQIDVYEQKVRDKVNTAAAATEFDEKASGADVDRQFAELRRNEGVDGKLAALKAKMAGATAPAAVPEPAK